MNYCTFWDMNKNNFEALTIQQKNQMLADTRF